MAILLLVGLPPGLLFWFWIHPFPVFWRRLGLGWTYTISLVVILGMMVGLVVTRDRWLSVEYGANGWLFAAGIACLVVAVWLALKRRKLLTFRILSGVPELSPSDPGTLLQEGIYGVIRHPRYVETLMGIAGYALLANYLAGYVLTVVSVPLVYLIVILEERELRDRFGEAYDRYRDRVPMFVPRFLRS